jgi:hypothetical protein
MPLVSKTIGQLQRPAALNLYPGLRFGIFVLDRNQYSKSFYANQYKNITPARQTSVL